MKFKAICIPCQGASYLVSLALFCTKSWKILRIITTGTSSGITEFLMFHGFTEQIHLILTYGQLQSAPTKCTHYKSKPDKMQKKAKLNKLHISYSVILCSFWDKRHGHYFMYPVTGEENKGFCFHVALMMKFQKRMQAASYPFSVYDPFLLSLILADKNLRKKSRMRWFVLCNTRKQAPVWWLRFLCTRGSLSCFPESSVGNNAKPPPEPLSRKPRGNSLQPNKSLEV